MWILHTNICWTVSQYQLNGYYDVIKKLCDVLADIFSCSINLLLYCKLIHFGFQTARAFPESFAVKMVLIRKSCAATTRSFHVWLSSSLSMAFKHPENQQYPGLSLKDSRAAQYHVTCLKMSLMWLKNDLMLVANTQFYCSTLFTLGNSPPCTVQHRYETLADPRLATIRRIKLWWLHHFVQTLFNAHQLWEVSRMSVYTFAVNSVMFGRTLADW